MVDNAMRLKRTTVLSGNFAKKLGNNGVGRARAASENIQMVSAHQFGQSKLANGQPGSVREEENASTDAVVEEESPTKGKRVDSASKGGGKVQSVH